MDAAQHVLDRLHVPADGGAAGQVAGHSLRQWAQPLQRFGPLGSERCRLAAALASAAVPHERACDAASLLLAGGALERAGFATRHEPGAAQRAFETWRTDKSRMRPARGEVGVEVSAAVSKLRVFEAAGGDARLGGRASA